jgi:hypothetical protein
MATQFDFGCSVFLKSVGHNLCRNVVERRGTAVDFVGN